MSSEIVAPNKFQVIGDDIYYEGFLVGYIHRSPGTVRQEFEDKIHEAVLNSEEEEEEEDTKESYARVCKALEETNEVLSELTERFATLTDAHERVKKELEEVLIEYAGYRRKYFRESFEVMLDNWK